MASTRQFQSYRYISQHYFGLNLFTPVLVSGSDSSQWGGPGWPAGGYNGHSAGHYPPAWYGGPGGDDHTVRTTDHQPPSPVPPAVSTPGPVLHGASDWEARPGACSWEWWPPPDPGPEPADWTHHQPWGDPAVANSAANGNHAGDLHHGGYEARERSGAW